MILTTIFFAIAGYSAITEIKENNFVTQEKCNANGVPNLYQLVQNENEQALEKCGTFELLERMVRKENLNNYFKSKCAATSKSKICTANAISLTKQCLNPQDIQLLEALEKIDEELLDYICNTYLENLSAFDKQEYKCWEEINLTLRNNCSQEMYGALTFRNLKEFTCSAYEDVEMCLGNNFPKHCNEQIRDIFLTGIKIIGRNVCEKPTSHKNEHKRLRRSVILRRIVRDIGVTHKLHKIEHKVKNLCITNGHQSEKLEESLENMKKCSEEKKIFLVPKGEYLHHMEKCSNKTIELFKSCLPDKYKYLPPFFFKILESMISFLYDDFIIISSELGPCIPKLNSKESTEEYDKCVAKTLDSVEDELVDSKEKFCHNWIPINECYIKQVKKECKPSKELTKFETDFMEAITKPCESK